MFETISTEEAKNIIDTVKPLIVDIRDRGSYEEAHIANAVHIDETNIAEFIGTADKERPVVCYCYHGFSSQSAADYFVQQGFKKVYSVNGGFEAWRAIFPSVAN